MLKFNNLRLALKFYKGVAKWLKLKVRKIFWGLGVNWVWWVRIPKFVEVAGEKLVEGDLFASPLHPE